MSLDATARWLVRERGFSVIPIDHPDATRYPDEPKKIGKLPIGPWKAFQNARPTDDNLAVWFGNGAPRNLAIVTGSVSNVVVVEGDSPEALAWMHAHLPMTDMRTKSARGEHWFYRHPGGHIPNKARLRVGGSPLEIDVRGDGGYVVVPGSKHASGVVYERIGTWPPVTALPCLYLAARAHPIADAGSTWDPDPYVLACSNGVVNLRTGEFREGQQADRLTMQTAAPYDSAARCPRFERFMLEITGQDRDLVSYLHRALGYSITGDISEQCLWFPFGPGSGGKTTLLRAIGATLGSYAYTAPFSTFLKDQHGSTITNDLAVLHGKRFVPASEVRERAKLDEGRIKSLTGGDPMTARFLHQEFFTFRPQLHLWLSVNHKPIVTDDSFGFWRRVRLVPFTQRFPVHSTLDAELQSEAAGILAWLVRGCLLWQMEGLEAPDSVVSATAQYEEDSDMLSDFIADELIVQAGASIGASEAYKLYTVWAERSGVTGRDRLSLKAFGR